MDYTPILGLPVLRAEYAAHLSGFYGAPIAPAEVGITSGCNQAFCLALMSIARAGDEEAARGVGERGLGLGRGRGRAHVGAFMRLLVTFTSQRAKRFISRATPRRRRAISERAER